MVRNTRQKRSRCAPCDTQFFSLSLSLSLARSLARSLTLSLSLSLSHSLSDLSALSPCIISHLSPLPSPPRRPRQCKLPLADLLRRRRLAGDLRLAPPGLDAIRPYSAPGQDLPPPPAIAPADVQARLAAGGGGGGGGGGGVPLRPVRAPGSETPGFEVREGG